MEPTTQHLMNGYSRIFEVSESCAKKFFKFYKPIFRANQVDKTDLIQEAYVKVLETIRKYPTKSYEEVFKLSNQAVSWRLRDLYNNSKDYLGSVAEMAQDTDKFHDILEASDIPSLVHFNDKLLYKYFNEAERAHKFHFEELLAILDDLEYNIVSERLKEGLSFSSIASRKQVSKQYIEKVYKKALIKAKKYIEITP